MKLRPDETPWQGGLGSSFYLDLGQVGLRCGHPGFPLSSLDGTVPGWA